MHPQRNGMHHFFFELRILVVATFAALILLGNF